MKYLAREKLFKNEEENRGEGKKMSQNGVTRLRICLLYRAYFTLKNTRASVARLGTNKTPCGVGNAKTLKKERL